MVGENSEADLRDLIMSLDRAVVRLCVLEGEIIGQKMAFSRCMFSLTLHQQKRGFARTLHVEVVGTACAPETDFAASGILGEAATAP